jgi:hypothetical protein
MLEPLGVGVLPNQELGPRAHQRLGSSSGDRSGGDSSRGVAAKPVAPAVPTPKIPARAAAAA